MLKVALIEDEKILSVSMAEELEEAGFVVKTAMDGESGLELVKKERPDIVLLDILMPKMNGMDVLLELKKLNDTRDIPIIILTVSSTDHTMKQLLEGGAEAYINKSHHKMSHIVGKLKDFCEENNLEV